MQVVRADHDYLLAHIAGNRQTEATADHVTEEVEEDVVEIPLVEAEFLQQLETVDDAASAAAAPDFGAAEFHRVDAVAHEAHVADLDFLARRLLLGGRLDDGRAGLAAEEQRGGVGFGVAADEQDALALLRHHVAEIREGEGLADAALAVDRDDLRFLGRLARMRRVRLDGGFVAQVLLEIVQREFGAIIQWCGH